MYSVVPDYFLFIGKGELLKWPLFGLFFKKMDIPVERGNSFKAHQALQKAYAAIQRGECIAMYPEGTIPASSPRMKSFKNGAFKMAVDLGVPIVPVTFVNNYKIMNDPESFFEYSMPHKVVAVVHPPEYPKGKTDQDLIDLRTRVFEAVNGALPEEHRKPMHPVKESEAENERK